MIRRVEDGVLTVLLLGMALLTFLQIILRNLFATGLVWADPLLRHLLLWLTLAGAVVATGEERHICVDALRRILPEGRGKGLVEISVNAFTALVAALLTYATFRVFHLEFENPQGGYIVPGLPLWFSILIMPLSFGLITLRSIRLTLISILDLWRGRG